MPNDILLGIEEMQHKSEVQLKHHFSLRAIKKGRVTRSVMGILALTLGVLGISSVSSAATAHRPVSPSASDGPVVNWTNTLARNTSGWCGYSPPNAPCNGQTGNYGTIDVVKHTFSNYGGYAASVAGPGQTHYGRISGAGSSASIFDSLSGCTVPGGENCTGPFTLFGPSNAGTDNVFPRNGFTTSIKIYLDTAWANTYPGNLIGWDTSLNNTSGSFLQDQTFDICSVTGGFFISTAFGSGGCTSGTPQVTTSGWYTFYEDFTAVPHGDVFDTYTVVDDSTSRSVFAPPAVDTTQPVSGVGGPLYGWFPDEDVQGLPIAQASLQKNT